MESIIVGVMLDFRGESRDVDDGLRDAHSFSVVLVRGKSDGSDNGDDGHAQHQF